MGSLRVSDHDWESKEKQGSVSTSITMVKCIIVPPVFIMFHSILFSKVETHKSARDDRERANFAVNCVRCLPRCKHV